LVCAKSVAFVPMIAMPLIVRVALPVFFSCMPFAPLVLPTFRLPKERLVGFRVTIGPKPVPARVTCCGLPVALSVMFMVEERFPSAVGVNVTLKVQLAPAATVVPQSLVCAKSPGFVPVIAMPVMDNEKLPVLVRVRFCGALVAPSG